MEVGKLTVQLRSQTGKGMSRRLRAHGFVPGVCYGSGIDAPLPLFVDPKQLKGSLDPLKRQNTVIDVTVEAEGKSTRRCLAMLWDYQIHPRRREVTHVDLLAIDPDKEIEVDVPLEITGKAAGTIEGGQIHVVRHAIPVSSKPANIPGRITVDVTPLDIGDAIHVGDLELPEGVEAAVPDHLTIVTCVAPAGELLAPTVEAAEGEAAPAAEGGEKPAAGEAAKPAS